MDHPAFQSQIPTPPTPDTASVPEQLVKRSNGNWKKWLLICGIVFVVLLTGTAYVLSQQDSQKSEMKTVTQPTVAQSSPTPEISYEPIPTANPTTIENWKTYTNTKYGTSFKYPPEFILSTKDDGVFFSTSSAQKQQTDTCLKQIECFDIYFGIQLSKKDKNSDLEGFFNTVIEKNYQYLYKAILIDEKKARAGGSNDRTGIGGGYLHNTFIEFDAFVLEVQAQTSEKSTMQTYQQILSTFKFTE